MSPAAAAEKIVLLVEDDDGHAMLTRQYLKRAGLKLPVLRFRDGLEAWEYLGGSGPEDKAPVMILDIRMPRMDGMELLRRMKEQARLKGIPVLMFTTTDSDEEVKACLASGCTKYFVKPLDAGRFSETVAEIAGQITSLPAAALPRN